MKPIFFLVVFCNTYTFGQTISGKVTNRKGEPIPLANIAAVGSRVGTLTSEDGLFTLISSDKFDSVSVSSIGYKLKTVALADIHKTSHIILDDNYSTLPAITVKDLSKFDEVKNIGYHRYKKNGGFRFGPGMQVAVYIPNTFGREVWIQGLYFNIKNFGKCEAAFRIRLFEAIDPDHAPGNDLLLSNVIVPYGDLRKSNYSDLAEYKIFLPVTGIFAGVEWLNSSPCSLHENPMLEGNLSFASNMTWSNFMGTAWRVTNPETIIRQGAKIITPNIGLKVLY